MPTLLIIAHTPLASALKAVALHAFPECATRIEALDVAPDAPQERIVADARVLLQVRGATEALVLTDVFGASPSNAAQRLAEQAGIRVVAGVNVPMLWRCLCYSGEPLDSLAGRAVAGAVQGVMQVASLRPQNQSLKPTAHDQDPSLHQQ